MSDPKKYDRQNLEPEIDLVDEDDEQTLPDTAEDTLDLAEEPAAGTLKAGRDAIIRYARHAPSAPGVYRMIGAGGDVLYVGKAKNIRKRITAYVRPTAYDSRIERMIAATTALEFVTTATETEALL